MMMRLTLGCVISISLGLAGFASETRVLFDFETPGELKAWEFRQGSGKLADAHVTHGKAALAIAAGEYMASFHNQDWSGYDSLDMDVFAETDEPVEVSVLIGDQAWKAKNGTYWNRYNGTFNLNPGSNTLSIPVGGLYRGEGGSRNNDLKSNIDPKTIVRFDLGFKARSAKGGTLYLDYMRLVKESVPEGVQAYDFGPENQVVFPGFTPVSWNTIYKKDGHGYGLHFAGYGPNSARDDGFPTRLYQDYVAMEGNEFLADVPDGNYHVWVMYDDCGYWGGEQARFRSRQITSDGKVLWSEDRGADGPSDYLYRFENIEPLPGINVWDIYMKPLFTAKRFEIAVKGGLLRLKFTSEGALGSKVAALIFYPDTKKEEGGKFVDEVEARNRAEFDARAAFIGPKPKANRPAQTVPIQWSALPLHTDLSFFDDFPPGGSYKLTAAGGQRVSFTFAVRPARDSGPVKLTVGELRSGTGAKIPASEIDVRVVRHALHRGFNNLAYTIGPDSLRPVESVELKAGYNRQFWITVHVPENAAGGAYTTDIELDAGEVKVSIPLSLDVLPLKLDEPDFAMGPFGVHVPDEIQDKPKALRELLTVLKQNGMNSFSGGPNVRFDGLNGDGTPKLDFAACDELMKAAREVGFDKELNSYGGPAMVQNLHDSYTIGETGRAWEKKTGKSMGELSEIVWKAISAHAKEANWLPVAYEMTDEPRVVEACAKELELMRLYRKHVPFVKIGGSYSVDWEKQDPFSLAVQDIFKTLEWSSLNLHNQTDFDKAKELGKQIYIYNQGTTRYSFGAYQWAEYRRGVRGRMQWHLLCLQGWQYFNLDGREPDTAFINWGKKEVIPTLNLARCREGADDFRFAVTLWNLAQKQPNSQAGRGAIQWLESVVKLIGPGQNTAPPGFMSDDDFRRGCAERIRALLAR